jgi:hypothetical protein
MNFEKPKISTLNQEYRDNLGKELKETRAEGGGFIKKALGKDGKSKAEKLLEKEKGTDEYKKAEKEQKEVREDLLKIKNWEELVSRVGVPSKEELYNIILNVEILKDDAGKMLLDNNPNNEELIFIIENVESLRYEAGKELLRKELGLKELWILVEKVEELRELAGRKIIMENERERWVLNNIIKNPKLDFLKKEAEYKIKILDRDKEIQKMDRYNTEINKNPQGRGETILLTLNEIDKLRKYINSGVAAYQSGFGRVFLSNGGSQGEISLFIDRRADFTGNILEYVDKFSNEIYRDTGIRFCYLEGRHTPVSEKLRNSNLNVLQFILVPKSIESIESI